MELSKSSNQYSNYIFSVSKGIFTLH